MAWRKMGLIYSPPRTGWMQSHAQEPTAILVEGVIRIYFGSRGSDNISLITFVDVDAADPSVVLYAHDAPIVPLGGPGTFDEFGLLPAAAIRNDNEVWLYVNGWQRGQTVPYVTAVGLLVSTDEGRTFKRRFDGPVLDRTPHEPYSTMSPCVIRDENFWQMWYGSGTAWFEINGKFEPIYRIKYASSHDGVNWSRPNISCIPYSDPEEAAARPAVTYDDGVYHMWFSYRGSRDFRGGSDSYRMGYATSQDGKTWLRNDAAAGVAPGAPGSWDSDMTAYPSIVDTPSGRYLFYNGNGFGRDGFGYAVWE